MKISPIARANRYSNAVVSGETPSCEMVRLACERYAKDRQRDDLYFDEKAVNMAVGFIEHLRHFKGEKAGSNLILEDWQCFICANIFGLKRKDTQRRKYTYADVFVPRKNGKTTFAAAIALAMMIIDGEPGAEIYAAAVDKEQAKICFDAAKEILRGTPFEQIVGIFRSAIIFPSSSGTFKPLSKDTKNKDGLNPHCAVCDERHAWKTNEIFDLLKTGIGARRQPLIFSISTAGVDTSLPYFGDISVLKDILRGIKEKDNHFALLFCPDEGDKYDDPLTWRKVNPNLGISLSEEYMVNECSDAKMKGGTTLAAFQTKNLNMWVDAPDVWLPDEAVAACNAPFNVDELKGRKCYVGIDLAAKKDITAVAFLFPDTEIPVVKYLFFVPESKIKEMEDRADYRLWCEQGWMIATPGSVLDEDWFVNALMNELDKYQVQSIAYDPWGMWNLLDKFGRYRDKLEEYRQSIGNMSVPTKEIESVVLKGKINFLGNPVIRWMFRNVVIYIDANNNYKLDKKRSTNKIDGVVALADAYGSYLTRQAEVSKKTVYTGHSLRIVEM